MAQGPLPSPRFVLSLEGQPQTAARRAAQALDKMRLGNGPGARQDALGGGPTPLYVHEDKSQQQLRVEALLRRAEHIIRDLLPGQQVRQLRREGVLAVGCRKLLRVVVPTHDEARLELNLAATALDVDRSVVVGRMEGSAMDAEEVVWCSEPLAMVGDVGLPSVATPPQWDSAAEGPPCLGVVKVS